MTRLTAREIELIRLYAAGNNQKAAARAMGITVSTTKDYTLRLRLKLGAGNIAQAAISAARLGLL